MWSSSTHVRNVQYWKWVNSDLWGYAPIIKYAYFKDNIIGSYVINPVKLLFKGKTIKAGFATQVLVHPEYRDLSIINDLNTSIVESCGHELVDFIYGFPNNSIWNVNLRLFGWNDAGGINYLRVDRNNFYKLNANIDTFFIDDSRINILKKFISEVSNRVNNDTIEFKITLDWFKWRFFDNPLQYYKVMCVEIDNNVHGVLVLKNYYNGENLVGHIVYIKTLTINYDVVSSLVRKAFDYFEYIGALEVTIWKTNNNWIMRFLQENGFVLVDDYYTNFGFKSIAMNNIDNIPGAEGWDISMSNSDAF